MASVYYNLGFGWLHHHPAAGYLFRTDEDWITGNSVSQDYLSKFKQTASRIQGPALKRLQSLSKTHIDDLTEELVEREKDHKNVELIE